MARGFPVFLHRAALGQERLDVDALKPFSLVALGLDLSSGCKTVQDFEQGLTSLLKLMRAASRTVLEIPKYRISQLLLAHLFRILRPTLVQDLTLDLSQDPVAFSYHVQDDRAIRRLLLIERTREVDLGASDVRALIALAAGELAEAAAKLALPVETSYRLARRSPSRLAAMPNPISGADGSAPNSGTAGCMAPSLGLSSLSKVSKRLGMRQVSIWF